MSKIQLQAALEELRAAEKAQASYYRSLAVLAEDAGDVQTAERLHDLHADEQHHLSRLTARLAELGHVPAQLADIPPLHPSELPRWEDVARAREAAEIERYVRFLHSDPEDATRLLVEAIIEVERHHLDDLAGKWTMA